LAVVHHVQALEIWDTKNTYPTSVGAYIPAKFRMSWHSMATYKGHFTENSCLSDENGNIKVDKRSYKTKCSAAKVLSPSQIFIKIVYSFLYNTTPFNLIIHQNARTNPDRSKSILLTFYPERLSYNRPPENSVRGRFIRQDSDLFQENLTHFLHDEVFRLWIYIIKNRIILRVRPDLPLTYLKLEI
jgi:hypothetical protein